MKKIKPISKFIAIFGAILVAGVLLWGGIHFYYVFGRGVKAGELNFFVYKGLVFKTYEGRLIQAGYNSKNTASAIQSNEFNFSVQDTKVAETLMRCSGKHVELYYKEYLGTLPWRGMSRYVVDSIISVEPAVSDNIFPN
ncbi:MAG: hypothetical protein J5606_07670 [Bacteroidales bacterium]|nr:hypothetical protein [Bacteroidales bacterium]